MKTVWITRTDIAKPNELPIGWQAINAPLLNVSPAATLPKHPGSDEVLIFTSGNGVKFFCEYTDNRDWPVYTVADATAELARSAGFETVTSAGKDITALRDLISTTTDLKSKRLYYASGQEVSGDLVRDLREQGYTIDRHILYETTPISRVPAAINTDNPICVFLYSPKGARAFRALDLDFSQLATISISANVDTELLGLGLKSRKIAQKPTHQDMIKQLS